MMRFTLAFLSAWLCAAPAGADDWSIGYRRLNGTFRYPVHDMTGGGFKNGKADMFQDLLYAGGAFMRSLPFGLEIGMAGGVGEPLKAWVFDMTKMEIPPATFPNRMTGDIAKTEAWTIPVLAKLAWGAGLGPLRVGLGLSSGMLLVASRSEITDQWWVDTLGNAGVLKMNTTDVAYGTQVERSSALDVLPMVELAPAAGLNLGEHDTIGVAVVLTWIELTKTSGKEETLVTASAIQPNPYSLVPGVELGGLTVGAELVWTRRF